MLFVTSWLFVHDQLLNRCCRQPCKSSRVTINMVVLCLGNWRLLQASSCLLLTRWFSCILLSTGRYIRSQLGGDSEMMSFCCKGGDIFFWVCWQVHAIYISVEMVLRWNHCPGKVVVTFFFVWICWHLASWILHFCSQVSGIVICQCWEVMSDDWWL